MKILIYGINYYPELTGIGKYSGEMATWLSADGHEIRVITAPPYYPDWCVGKSYSAFRYQKETIVGVEVNRVPIFVPRKPKTITRLLHLASFSISSMPILFKQLFWKPDIVITIEPTLFCAPATLLFAKLSSTKSLLHIQDFELDAMLGLGMGKKGFVSTLGGKIEKWLMTHFDAISSISYSMVEYAKQKLGGKDNVLYFPNWVDVSFITPNADRNIFLEKWNISEQTKVVLYSGNLGKKQGLEIVIDAAKELSRHEDIAFIIVGDGAAKKDIIQKAKNLYLENVSFFPLQSYEDLPALMSLADIHLVVQKKGAADAVLPSKLTTILSAGGTALITAEKSTELGVLCDKHLGIAYRVEPEDPQAFTEALSKLLSQVDVKNRTFNQIARSYAVEYLNKDNVLKRFNLDLEDLVSG